MDCLSIQRSLPDYLSVEEIACHIMQQSDIHLSPRSTEAKLQLQENAYGYHEIGCWVAVILNPLFILTDYFNMHAHWQNLLVIRLVSSALILGAILLRKKLKLNASVLISIPLVLISFQNAYVYQFIDVKELLGQHLNYMALFIGASLFVLWRWIYSLIVLLVSGVATAWFVYQNPLIGYDSFFVHGGLLLLATGIFMIILIQTRYRLILKTIRARLELMESKRQIEKQAMIIKAINETLAKKVEQRMEELKAKNKILEDYAFINSHNLRAPVASIMGIVKLFSYMELDPEKAQMVEYLNKATAELDEVIRGISKKISEK